MLYVPSPIPIQFSFIYTATANPSGRMQYHRVKPGHSKIRISRSEFIGTYNDAKIIAIKPLQLPKEETAFQFEFYV